MIDGANTGENTARKGRNTKGLRPPWKPGQSGNPSGRPKRDVFADIAKRVFEDNEEAVYKAVLKAALKANAQILKELGDRAYGKVRDRIELSGPEAGPVHTTYTVNIVERKSDEELGLKVPRPDVSHEE